MADKIEDKIEEIFSRGVGEFIDPENKFKEKLQAKIKGEYKGDIIVKFGIDPTRPNIHLGQAVALRKLRQLQDMGCKAVFLIGDYTARIGDPGGKSKTRPEVEQKEVEQNMKTYLEQVGKILRTDSQVFSWIRNSDWFTGITDLNLPKDYKINLEVRHEGKKIKVPINPNSFMGKALVFEKSRMQVANLGLKEKISVISLANFLWTLKHITHSRLIERDMFQERIKKGEELYMHEVMYPVLQGVDSQVLSQIYGSCDLEIGGTDQTFNMLVGRDIMKINKQEQQAVLSLSLLIGTDGKEKMSMSLDNYIGITEVPSEIYGKIMSIHDSLISHYFELCTYTPPGDIERIKKDLEEEKVNPKDVKMRLAKEIVSIYHGEDKAIEAEKEFDKVFKKKEVPEEIEEIKAKKGEKLIEILSGTTLIKSKNEFRRLIEKGAIEDLELKQKIEDQNYTIEKGLVLRIGKHRFVKIIID